LEEVIMSQKMRSARRFPREDNGTSALLLQREPDHTGKPWPVFGRFQ